MSNVNTQMMNDILIEESKEEDERMRSKSKYYDLKTEYQQRFRLNHEQGIFCEMLVPIYFHYLMGTFDLEWFYC